MITAPTTVGGCHGPCLAPMRPAAKTPVPSSSSAHLPSNRSRIPTNPPSPPNPLTTSRYAAVVRARTDMVFQFTVPSGVWDVSRFARGMAGGTIYEPPCGRYLNGMNDQLLVGSGAAMSAFMRVYYHIPWLYDNQVGRCVWSSPSDQLRCLSGLSPAPPRHTTNTTASPAPPRQPPTPLPPQLRRDIPPTPLLHRLYSPSLSHSAEGGACFSIRRASPGVLRTCWVSRRECCGCRPTQIKRRRRHVWEAPTRGAISPRRGTSCT